MLPVTLIVPANTSLPAFFSMGTLSPVNAASLIAEWPSVICPSSGMRSPGATLIIAPGAIWLTGVVTHVPSCHNKAVGGVSDNSCAMLWRALSTVLASIMSARENNTITMAASAHWPMMQDQVTATVIRELGRASCRERV